MIAYAADFETTTDKDDCRVWAYGLSSVDNQEFSYGTTMEDFIEFCKNPKINYTLFFHNLKFDGSFILSWLLSNGFTHIEDKKNRADNTFATLITDRGQFYCIDIYFYVGKNSLNKVRILDSLKIFPNFSVENVAKAFALPLSKLEIDYNKPRPVGYQLTPHEVEYLRADVEIMSRALKIMFDQGLNKMTIASDAFASYKSFIPSYRGRFPVLPLDMDAEIRTAYRGGFTYVNEIYQEKEVGKGITIDKNSMYPSKMVQEDLPFGKPERFTGEYQYDQERPLYIQTFTCSFELKKGKIPSVQLKNNLSFMPNEYLSTSGGEMVTLSMCSPDFILFRENYHVFDLKYHGGWKFKACKGLFKEYVDHWMNEKIKATKEGNQPIRTIAKTMLNSLYGRFGLNPIGRKKAPYLDEDGVVKFSLLPEEEREPIYIPVACFITSYGRVDTIRTSQRIRDYSLKKYGKDAYLYSDTDSIHCTLTDEDLEALKGDIFIDEYALGAWAKEASFDRALFIRQKCYVEEIEGKLNVTVAGLPKYLTPLITFENFKRGFSTEGLTLDEMINLASKNGATKEEIQKLHPKLTYKYVKGGVVLSDTDFTIK